LEAEANMSKKIKAAVSHYEREVAELRAVAEAYGGLGAVAAE
jgi:hypothetical protein